RGEPLAQSEMAALERDEVSELESTGQASRFDDSLAGKSGTSGMRVDVTREIEADLRRRGDERLDDDPGQDRLLRVGGAAVHNRSRERFSHARDDSSA